MPRYRKLHTSTIDSLDIDAMPDDFHRLTWVLLPLILCRDGRGMYYPTWLRSKLYPLRSDVTDSMVTNVFAWYERRGMIVSYEVDGRRYFYIPTWQKFQGITTKESESPYPEPLQSSARQAPDLLQTNSIPSQSPMNIESESESESEDASASVEPFRILFDAFLDASGISELMIVGSRAVDEINNKWIPSGVTPDEVKGAVKALQDKGYNITGPWSVTNTINMVRSKKKGKSARPGSEYKLPDDWNDYEMDDKDDVKPEGDAKWRMFIDEYVKSRRWQNLLEFGGYDDSGKVIVKVPDAAMAEAESRLGSMFRRYLGEYILEGIAV